MVEINGIAREKKESFFILVHGDAKCSAYYVAMANENNYSLMISSA